MPVTTVSRAQALDLLKKYNQEPFHLLHSFTVEAVMGWFAVHLGYENEKDFWTMTGLLHDIEFEKFPNEHCQKAPELLAEINAEHELVRAVCAHAYGMASDVKPEHEMEKVLFACDELTGLIGAAARMPPSATLATRAWASFKFCIFSPAASILARNSRPP